MIVLSVRLTPRSSVDRIETAEQAADGNWSLAARVRAVPEKGKANAALLTLLAETLDLPKSALELVGGSRSREKRVRVGADPDRIGHALGALHAGGSGNRA